MPRDELKPKDSTGLILTVYLRSLTTGQGLTGKTHSDFAGQWNRGNAASSPLSFAAGSVGDPHSSGKIVELGNGRYFWHVPNSLFTSVGQVVATLQVDGAIDVKIEWQVVEVDRESAAFGANTTMPLDATAIQAAAAASIAAANLAQPGDEMALTPENLIALFADVDVAGLVASVTAAFDEATDLPVQTIAAEAATRTVAAVVANAQILTLIANAASANSAATSVDTKLTDARAAKLDRDLAHAGDAATYQATVPTVGEIDNQLTSTHGAGAWTSGGGGSAGSGQFKQDLLITNQADVPIPRAIITVLSVEGASLGIYTASGTEGEASLMLDAGEYFLAVTAYPTHDASTQAITINGDPSPVTIQLFASAPSPPEIAGLCRVRIPVREANSAAQAAQVSAQLVGENQKVGNDLLSRAVTRGESDATGYVDLLLAQGLTYRVVGTHGGHGFLDLIYVVPMLSEAYIAAAIV